MASAKCLVTDPDAEEALVKFCPAGQSSSDVSEQGLSFPLFLSGPQDRYHRDVWWEALSAQVQVTQEAVLLIDSRFGFFLKKNGVHVLEATDLCQVTQNVFNCMTVPVATELSVSCLPVSIFIFPQQMLRYSCVFLNGI